MKLVAQYLYLNLWLAIVWILLLTYDGTLSPMMGTLLAYAALISLINLGWLLRRLLPSGRGAPPKG